MPGHGSSTAAHRDVLRARIVLATAAGRSNQQIAAQVGMCLDTVPKWRGRFARDRLPGLDDLPRTGRPRTFSGVQAAQVKALACTKPASSDLPLARWSALELATQAVAQGITAAISPSTVRRWLREGAESS